MQTPVTKVAGEQSFPGNLSTPRQAVLPKKEGVGRGGSLRARSSPGPLQPSLGRGPGFLDGESIS